MTRCIAILAVALALTLAPAADGSAVARGPAPVAPFGAYAGEGSSTALAAMPPDLARFVGTRLDAASAVADHGRPGASSPMALGAEQAGAPAWQSVQTPARSLQVDVDMVLPDEAWAVSLSTAEGQPTEILRYRDGVWRIVEEYGSERYLWAVDMTAPDEGWIAGFDVSGGSPHPVLLPIRSGQVGEPIPNACSTLFDVHMFGTGDGWAVGNQASDGVSSSCILRHSDGMWERTDSPGAALLVAVQMVGPDEGWALGSEGDLLHFRGGVWHEAASPVAADATGLFYDLSIAEGGEGWAVGSNAHNTLRYHDRAWRVVDLGFTGFFSGVDMVSAAEGWAVGYAQPDPIGPLVFAFHVEGDRWSAVESPAFPYRLGSIDMLSATDGWAVGLQSSARYSAVPTATASATATATPTQTSTAIMTPSPTPSPAPSRAPIYLPSARRD